jgi:hypothetical protein
MQGTVFGDSQRFTAVDDADSALGNGFKPGKQFCLAMNGFRSNDFSCTQKI